MSYLLAILGLAVLMVVHESGHHFVARAFGLRVLRFSIGFGPTIWKHQPRGSDTVYQVALVPFLAYVQVAGMNPFEENDPDDKGSYANASLTARIATVFAGPLANYVFASVLFFAAFITVGKPVTVSTVVRVMDGSAASLGEMRDGDKIVRIDDADIKNFEEMRQIILKNPSKELAIAVLRDEQALTLKVTPRPEGEKGGGVIGVRPRTTYEPMGFNEAFTESLAKPALVVEGLVVGLGRVITGREKPEVSGPVGIVKYGADMVEAGAYELLLFFGMLSAYLGGFNLLPIPALDGGRLMFLGYEAVARRKPNAKVEAQIHALGLIMFLALIAVVTLQDFQK
ncbi:MAG: hypothetical protein RJA70_875 [Pseudomonadota bacterium]|jgi:regulator of sigma E protease